MDELFHAVDEMSPEDRRRHLDAHCRDPSERAEVESLLAANDALHSPPPGTIRTRGSTAGSGATESSARSPGAR